MEWMSSGIGKYFQIEGGKSHNGYKEFDVAIADHLTSTMKQKATMEARIIVEECRRWEHLELQNGGEFNNDDSFSWVYKSYTAKGSRTAIVHKNKWSLWATKVKTIAVSIMTEKRTAVTEECDSGHGTANQKRTLAGSIN